MSEQLSLALRDLIDFAERIQRDGVAPHRDPGLTCVWGRDPGTGRLESHWVTELPEYRGIKAGIF